MGSRLQDVIMRDTRANQPLATAVSAGTLYYVTDEGVTERSNGTTWQSFSDSGVVAQLIISAGTLTGSRSSLVFSDSNGVSFGMAGSTVTAQHNGLTNVKISAGTTSNNLSVFVFSNSNNVSFGLDGSTVTASATIATSLSNIRVSAGAGDELLSAITFSNGGGVSFGINASVVTATINTSLTNIKVSAGGSSALLSALTFSNGNGVSFGLSDGTITASASGGGGGGATFNNFFANFYAITDGRSAVYGNNLYIMPMQLPAALSANYLRYLVSMQSNQNRTFGATSTNTSWSAEQRITFHNQLLTRGTGASSNSLFSVSNFTAGLTVRTAFTNNTTGSQWTASFLMTAMAETGANVVFTTSYACTSNSYVINTGGGNFGNAINGSRWIEVPFNTSVPGGNYYMVFGRSTVTTKDAGGATGLSTTNFEFCMVGMSYTTAAMSRFAITDAVSTGVFGMGLITSNTTNISTDSVNVSSLMATGGPQALLIPFMVH